MRNRFVTSSSRPRPGRFRRLHGGRQLGRLPLVAGVAALIAACGGSAASRPGESRSAHRAEPASHTASQAAGADFGSFAGYNWHGDVTEVSGSIVVPRILPGSGDGFAGSWIGATAYIGVRAPVATPFIQIGVNEARGRYLDGPPRNAYYVFWSGTALGFHPKLIFVVAPGDRVDLSMRLAGGRWSLAAVDRTTGTRQRLSTADDADARFVSATWTQEDVSNARSGGEFPYPQLGPVRFARLTVNGHRPAAGALRATWMSTASAIFGPGSPVDDAFEVVTEHPSAEALRFQRIAVAVDLPAQAFAAELAGWPPAASPARVRRDSLAYAGSLQTMTVDLQDGRWSSAVTPLIAELIARIRRFRQLLIELADRPPARTSVFEQRLREGRFGSISRLAKAIKRRLGLPQTGLPVSVIERYIARHNG